MNWYKVANTITAYHGTNQDFDRFDRSMGAQGVIWFSTDVNDIINGTSGAVSTKIIKEVRLNINNPAGWKEYNDLFLQQIEDMGYDSIILDKNVVIFDPANIQIVNQNILGGNNELV